MTALLLFLASLVLFALWIGALIRLDYWRDRARYAERLERIRASEPTWRFDSRPIQPRKPTETEK